MSANARRLILALSLVGLGFAGASTWVHYKLLTQPNYSSPCDINDAFNCTQAYLSQYGSLWGIPVALLGLLWFVLVGFIALMAKPSAPKAPSTSAAGAYIFALATVGLGFSLYLAYASFFILKTGCILCIGTYVSVLGIFLVSGSSSASVAKLPGRLPRDLRDTFADPVSFLLAAIFVVAGASLIAFFPRESSPGPTGPNAEAATTAPAGTVSADLESRFRAAWARQPRADLGVPADGAQVVIVKFIDWQCPSCRNAHWAYRPVLQKFEQSHPGAVRQVIKDYPLSNKCNFQIPRDAHPAACEAAVGARVARERGREEDFVNWIFTAPNQQSISAREMKDKVTSMLGLKPGEFDALYTQHIEAVKRDISDAAALNVSQTPTYYVNGIMAKTEEGWLPPQLFELAIRIELESKENKENK